MRNSKPLIKCKMGEKEPVAVYYDPTFKPVAVYYDPTFKSEFTAQLARG